MFGVGIEGFESQWFLGADMLLQGMMGQMGQMGQMASDSMLYPLGWDNHWDSNVLGRRRRQKVTWSF